MHDQPLDKLISDLADLFGVTLTPQQFAWYELALQDLPHQRVVQAMQHAMLSCKFFPKPAELRELAGVNEKLSSSEQAEIAWKAVLSAIRQVGEYDSVDFSDRVINATIRDLGGWIKVAGIESKDLHWLEQRFCRAYLANLKVALPPESLKRLSGFTETMNARNGYGRHPIPVATVPSLTCLQTGRIVRKLEAAEPTTGLVKSSVSGPSSVEKVATALSVISENCGSESTTSPRLSPAEQAQLLAAMARKREHRPLDLEAEVNLVRRREGNADERTRELHRLSSAPISETI